MKHFKTLTLVSASALTFVASAAVPASAADIVRAQPVAPSPVVTVTPQDSWAGGYTGLYLGGAKNRFGSAVNEGSLNKKAAKFGAYSGWNFQSGNIVYGVEGDAGYNTAKAGKVSESEASVKTGFEGSLRGRLGYDMGVFMPYVTAGIAGTQMKYNGGDLGSKKTFRTGWTAGVGTEAKLTDNITARVEYRYSDFGKKSVQLSPAAYIPDSKFKTHEIRLGVGYKF